MSDDVRDKICKLLAVAADEAATQSEIENAMRAADALMMRHRISEEELRRYRYSHAIPDEVRCAREQVWSTDKGLAEWETALAWFVCRFVGTVQWYRQTNCVVRSPAGVLPGTKTGRVRTANQVSFYGPAEDVEIVVELWRELQRTVIVLSQLKYGGSLRGPSRSYAEGFVNGLSDRLRVARQQIEQQQQSEGCGTALVVQNQQLAARQRAVATTWLQAELGVRVRSSGGGGNGKYHHGAFGQGQADGRNTNIERRASMKKLT